MRYFYCKKVENGKFPENGDFFTFSGKTRQPLVQFEWILYRNYSEWSQLFKGSKIIYRWIWFHIDFVLINEKWYNSTTRQNNLTNESEMDGMTFQNVSVSPFVAQNMDYTCPHTINILWKLNFEILLYFLQKWKKIEKGVHKNTLCVTISKMIFNYIIESMNSIWDSSSETKCARMIFFGRENTDEVYYISLKYCLKFDFWIF